MYTGRSLLSCKLFSETSASEVQSTSREGPGEDASEQCPLSELPSFTGRWSCGICTPVRAAHIGTCIALSAGVFGTEVCGLGASLLLSWALSEPGGVRMEVFPGAEVLLGMPAHSVQGSIVGACCAAVEIGGRIGGCQHTSGMVNLNVLLLRYMLMSKSAAKVPRQRQRRMPKHDRRKTYERGISSKTVGL